MAAHEKGLVAVGVRAAAWPGFGCRRQECAHAINGECTMPSTVHCHGEMLLHCVREPAQTGVCIPGRPVPFCAACILQHKCSSHLFAASRCEWNPAETSRLEPRAWPLGGTMSDCCTMYLPQSCCLAWTVRRLASSKPSGLFSAPWSMQIHAEQWDQVRRPLPSLPRGPVHRACRICCASAAWQW